MFGLLWFFFGDELFEFLFFFLKYNKDLMLKLMFLKMVLFKMDFCVVFD